MIVRLLLILNLLFAASVASAAQLISAGDGDDVKINISRSDVNRLSIEGNGRLIKIWSPQGFLDLEADKEQGEAFFKAKPNSPTTFSFFARDDFGNTFTIVATQKKMPSQTVIISPQSRSVISGDTVNPGSALPYKKKVNSLFKSMFNNSRHRGYRISTIEKPVEVWKETEFLLLKRYIGYGFQGEVYSVKNISDSPLIFHEAEFFGFGENVLAVGLEHLKVGVNKKTLIYIVRSTDKEGRS